MKQSNIPVIVFSVIAFLMFLIVAASAAFIIAYNVRHPEARQTNPPQTQETETDPSNRQTTPDVTEDKTPDKTTNEETGSSQTSAVPSETTQEPTAATETTRDDSEKPYVLKQTGDAGMEYQNKLIFFGDSTTYHLIVNKVLPDGEDTRQVWFGPNGTLSLPFATTNDIFDKLNAPISEGLPLSEIASKKHPEILVITLGLGVSAELNKSAFKTSYNAVIDTVLESSPRTKIICQSIYPVCRTGTALGNLNNPDIVKANGWISECVGEHYSAGQKVYFLDSHSILADSEGYLPSNLSQNDGIHLNTDGYRIILENIRRHKLPD